MSVPASADPARGRRNLRRARRRTGGARAPLRGFLPIVLLLAVWQAVGSASSFTLPPPSTWITGLEDLQQEGALLPAIRTTLLTFAIAMVLATVIGAGLGMLIGGSRRVDRALTPLLDFFRTLPPPAVVPVAALLFGASLQMAVTVVVLAVVWPILLNTATAMRSVPPVRFEVARTLGLSRNQRLWKIVVPSLAPSTFLGVRIAVSDALIVTLLVDILGTGEGVGRLLVFSQQTFEASQTWGLLLLVGAFGYLINLGVASSEDRLFRNWPEGIRR